MKSKLIFLYLFFMLLAKLPAYESSPRASLSNAIKRGSLGEVERLITSSEVGVDDLSDVSYDRKSPLVEAAFEGQVPILEFLIKRGAFVEGVSDKGYSPLVELIKVAHKVSLENLLKAVTLFVEAGADINSNGKLEDTPLMASCQYLRSIKVLELLLEKGAFIDFKTKEGKTACLVAISNNNVKAYETLIKHGANTNISYRRATPFSQLAWEGNIFMAKRLLEDQKIDVNAFNENGTTPLIYAAVGGSVSMVQFLVKEGANVNAKTKSDIDLELKEENGLMRIFPNYVTFPKGSTALNFAKTMSNASMENYLSLLGGEIYKDVKFEKKWGGLKW